MTSFVTDTVSIDTLHSGRRPSSYVESLSEFDETACGEPLEQQHLRLDFTPTHEDNDVMQEKVCAFWQFIADTPELKSLMVLPKKGSSRDKATSYRSEESLMSSYSMKRRMSAKSSRGADVTAVSTLELVDGKEYDILINRIFEAKTKNSACSLLEPREYIEMHTPSSPHRKKKLPCQCTAICDECFGVTAKRLKETSLKKLYSDMKEWDAQHHKMLMGPPRFCSASECGTAPTQC
ncbi:unnamed protein product [Chrysodeixis includens]|uniref:Uncharacterized protein n=1 Tax=Chrysodeixis includens TaxID=689277 RepID=A0A9P0FPI8_CHRIL|nr:unnamed protein product [Chrysodeixis includens]